MNIVFKCIYWCVVGCCAGILAYHYVILPRIIDRRANDLGLMQFSSRAGKMIARDDVKYTLYYLKYGSMK